MTAYRYVKDVVQDAPSTEVVQRTADSAFIPNNPDNRDWVAYTAWLDQGNTPDPYEGGEGA